MIIVINRSYKKDAKLIPSADQARICPLKQEAATLEKCPTSYLDRPVLPYFFELTSLAAKH